MEGVEANKLIYIVIPSRLYMYQMLEINSYSTLALLIKLGKPFDIDEAYI